MDYRITIDKETEKEIEVAAPVSELDPFIEEQTDKLRKETEIRGFRKGKVPREIMKTKFRDTIKANAFNDLITKSYHAIIREKNWQIASPVQVLDIEEGATLKFRLHVEIIPDFPVDNYLGLEIVKQKPLPPEVLLKEAMNELQERSAVLKETGEPAAVDNFVTLDLEIAEDNVIKNKDRDVSIRVGDRNFPDEINRVLVGAKKGQTREASIDKRTYRLVIKKVEERILPMLDDAFAKSAGFTDFHALEEKLRTDAARREENRIDEEMKESLARVILERIRFTPPQSLVEEEYQDIIRSGNLPDSDSTKERFWKVAENRVRFNLIVDRIGLKNNITVEDAEVDNLLTLMRINLSDENRPRIMNYFRNLLTRQRTVDFILKHSKLSETGRIVTPKEATNANRPLRH